MEHLTARRNLIRIGSQAKTEFPSWLSWFIMVTAIALVAYVVAQDPNSVLAVAFTVFGALVMIIAGFSLPMLTKLKIGTIEIEKEVFLSASQALKPMPRPDTRFNMIRPPSAPVTLIKPAVKTALEEPKIQQP